MEVRLAAFVSEKGFRGKGPLSVALVVTEHARNMGLPLDPEKLLTKAGGQVLELGRAKVQAILARHGIVRVLAKEAGRTSRGSIEKMREYVALLNDLAKDGKNVDIDAIESFWIRRVQEFFAGRPFSLRLDSTLSLRTVIQNLMRQAADRQKEMPGTMFLGTIMQHLVGAKLDLVLGSGFVQHHGSNENDEGDDRTGDFDTGDVSIHVSSAPSEALIQKCVANLDAGRRPIIVTTSGGVGVADGLAGNYGVAERLEVIEFEQFIATNIYELGRFVADQRNVRIRDLLARYNEIVEANETDPGLRIEISKGK